jgi:hypothetical protein
VARVVATATGADSQMSLKHNAGLFISYVLELIFCNNYIFGLETSTERQDRTTVPVDFSQHSISAEM